MIVADFRIINKKGALDNIRKILKEKGCKIQVSYLDIDLDIAKGSIVTDAVKMNKEICYNLLAELKKRLKISIFLWRKSCASR